MKLIVKSFAFLTAILFSIQSVSAQAPITPRPSSGQTIVQDFGLGKVTVTYSRPNTKGRKIFGGLEPYGAVWRTGANEATTIEFSNEVSLGGKLVPAGKYGLFTIPGEKEWTVIINKTANQWGAYDYKQADDLLRFSVKAINTKAPIETFTILFTNVKEESMNLNLIWEKTEIVIPMTVDEDTQVMANIDKAMQGDKKPYYAAMQYYYEHDKDLSKALEWANILEKSDMKATYYTLWKARIQLKMGDKAAALATATEGAKLAKESNNDEYVRLNQAVINQAKK
ncbi:MAG: DUF2911 domain-containing protein [Bacteroidetes bacterium]|nr:DUF2911 domain-containing protein [Bacteroidota bacterium]MBU1373467.1 DUF2911 domain-containing protein [Bacteroidota bacterium]MBU1485225.1 DUF2911 domain-containing protein [Bacteroidota bacterium]MBU1759379.1 DUF2911 domain-containing protein [Bacteroidota bacterium]MBU2267854.1 DUF2911 domain-containing protein [Bacteroidota bacterium]